MKERNKIKVIGLTGGIGSGKTFIATYAKEKFGVPIILADEVGHIALEPGRKTYYKVLEVFGKEIMERNNGIDREKLSKIVFEDKKKLELLNGIVHPFIKEWIEKEIQRIKEEKTVKYIILEAAILLESSLVNLCDEIWFVQTEENVRRARLKESRGYSEEKIDHIIKAQLSQEEMQKKSDFIISNTEDLKELQKQLEVLLV
ncbi:MAG: dephospho-CoA kinase [Acetivibrio sp.]